MKFTHLFILSTSLLPLIAFAGAYQEENIKMHCAILKNNKVIKQQRCTAEGYVHGGAAYGGGSGYSFGLISGYGKIQVDTSASVIYDKNNNPILDKDGFAEMETSTTMNNKNAIIRYRMPKTFQLLTQAQEKQYNSGSLKIQPYTCFIHTQSPKFEFCFSKPLMG